MFSLCIVTKVTADITFAGKIGKIHTPTAQVTNTERCKS